MSRLWLSTAMLACGVGLMAAAQLAGAAPERRGGVFKFGTTGASVQIDPQLSYITTGWWLEYATAAKLYNYRPGGRLVPEVASRYKVSNSGRRYTFFIRKGFRFSDGTPVTAASFKYAINRVANKGLSSPGAQLITDLNGSDIVGALAVTEGNATDVTGARVSGNKLIVDLTRRDPKFITVLAMPFFQATSARIPLDHEVVEVRSMSDLPSAGPYAFALHHVNRLTQLRRNPYWKPGPGRTAPRNLDGLDVLWNLNEQTAFEQVESGELDESAVPGSEVQNVASQYGVNRTRFWVKPSKCIGLVAFNTRRGRLRGNTAMRRAINWAIDRTDYVATASLYSQTAWTHLLPPGFPGSVTKASLQPYPVRANIARARQIASGHYGDGRIIVTFRSPGAKPSLVRRDLTRLGLEVTMVPQFGGDEPAEWDVGLTGYCFDMSDPSEIVKLLGYWSPLSSKYLLRVRAANGLTGNARLRALGQLDLSIMKNVAPLAVMHTYNNRYFFSESVDPRSLRYHAHYEDWSIPHLALK
jgi:ABC-type oligopeptide transport system substrate-binding subunit